MQQTVFFGFINRREKRIFSIFVIDNEQGRKMKEVKKNEGSEEKMEEVKKNKKEKENAKKKING